MRRVYSTTTGLFDEMQDGRARKPEVWEHSMSVP